MNMHERRCSRHTSRAGEVRHQLAHHLEALRHQDVSPDEAIESLTAIVIQVLEEKDAGTPPTEPEAATSEPRRESEALLADLREIPPRMSVSAATVLHLIRSRANATPSELSQALGVSPAAMTGTIDTLARMDLVVRKGDSVDRRRVKLELTGEGARLADRIFPAA